MKIGLISDIHSNMHALQKVLESLDAHQVDLILCAGDIVSYGAYPNEVIDILRERGIPCVTGNYDDAVAWNRPRAARQASTPRNEPLKQAALDWVKTHITPQNRRFLKGLPWTLGFCFDGLRISVLHAGLEYLDEWQTLDQPGGFAVLADYLRADVIVLGHSHEAFTFRHHHTVLINPGAVGRSLDSDPRAAYAVYDTQDRGVHLLRVDYDIEGACQAIANSSMPVEIATMMRFGARRVEQVSVYENS